MFLKYRKNIFSQNGEDGVIQEILRRLKLKKEINGVVNSERGMANMEAILSIL